ncbi:MAG: chromate transporter, partial [Planctomycetaceae bacterium]|nr:chromate transporter [Planctomycetaceae bacterium]
FGLKPAVVAIVVQAVLRLGRRALKNGAMVALAAAAFVGIFFFQLPFPLIVVAAGLIGYVGGRWWPQIFVVIKGHDASTGESERAASDPQATSVQPTVGGTLRTAFIWLFLWWGPVAGLWLANGRDGVFTEQGVFFSKASVVTFGGAYAVLAYIAQEAVNTYGWLRPGEMLDGLAMAETTPGPLIQVVQFVGFMGAYRNPMPFTPMTAGIIGSLVTTWVTFTPCFLWIFVGAPYIELLRGRPALNAALSGITAAVVGVVLNLSLWFALQTLFAEVDEIHLGALRLLIPKWETLQLTAAALTVLAFVAIFKFKAGMLWTLFVSAALGCLLHLVVDM